MNPSGTGSTGFHSQYYSRCTGNGITACEHSRSAGLSGVFRCGYATPLVGFQTVSCVFNKRIWRSSERHDYSIAIYYVFAAGNFNRATTTALIRFSKLHFNDFHAFYPAVFIGENFFRIGEQVENYPFFFGVVNFFFSGWQFGLATSIYDMNLRTKP